MLYVDHLSIRFQKDESCAVKDVSLRINAHERVGLMGASGSGKSTLAYALLRLLKGAQCTGQIVFQKIDLLTAPNKHLMDIRGGKIALVFQEPMSALNPLHRVDRQVRESLYLHGKLCDPDAVCTLFCKVKLSRSDMSKYPHELSGGQRQRIVIAMALAGGPELLIADEPTTALDPVTQHDILTLLLDLCAQEKMALLFISHDCSIVKKMVQRLYVFEAGRMIEEGDVHHVMRKPQSAHTKRLLTREFHTSLQPAGSDVVLRAQNMTITYESQAKFFRKKVDKAVDDVGFELRQGETLGIVGHSGSGKSSLGLALVGLAPCSGAVTLRSVRYDRLSGRALKKARRHFQMVFQDPYTSLSPRMCVRELLAEGLLAHGLSSACETSHAVQEALGCVGLSRECMERYPHEFSGGQRQRIALARALIVKPTVLILDEPTASLDHFLQSGIIDLLIRLQQRLGVSYIFISHNLTIVRQMCHRVLVLSQGRCIASGPTCECLNNNDMRRHCI